ncbi:MAG: Trm112 family protein [Candidatus Krumholzibacteriota bacterium]|nr:Trm112 family protein [Candidatus Krumholzibacteriota bacterium]
MIRKDLLDILACPRCHEKVILSDDEKWLVCNECSVRYPVEDDIPIMLVERSENIES